MNTLYITFLFGSKHIKAYMVKFRTMAISPSLQGETRWSQCSVNSLSNAISQGQLRCLDDDNGAKVELISRGKFFDFVCNFVMLSMHLLLS